MRSPASPPAPRPARLLLALAALVVAGTSCADNSSTTNLRGDTLATGEQPIVRRHLTHAALLRGEESTERLLDHGALLFAASFHRLDGAGRPATTGTGQPRTPEGMLHGVNRISAPDANSCAGCHALPRPGGGGDNVANVFVMAQRLPSVNFDRGRGDEFEDHDLDNVGNERGTIGMWGSGYIELLAREMTTALHALRDEAVARARRDAAPVRVALLAKGVDYGFLTARADGSLDTSELDGVDADLIVKPFHQKGVVISLREFTNNAMNHHFGMQSAERFGAGTDPDADGHRDELLDGDITAASLWQATLPVPGRVWPGNGAQRAAAERGERLFAEVGCASCHVPELVLDDPVFSEPNPFNPKGNLQLADVPAPLAFDLTTTGPSPRLPRGGDGKVRVPAYTDLKRHDMGPQLNNEMLVQGGVPTSVFLTKKLWGAASEPPYMHHGRALTLDEAIRMHGGDAQASRDAYAARPAADREAIVEFLQTLQVLPDGHESLELVGPETDRVGDDPAVARHLDQRALESGDLSPAEIFAAGEALFGASFNTLDGAGRPETTGTGAPRARREAPQNFNRLSGPDANSCAGCHALPRIGGGGDSVANVFVLAQRLPFVNFDGGLGDQNQLHHLDNVGNERNTLGMWGAGYIEMVAREMTAHLHDLRRGALAEARAKNAPQRVELVAKGVAFGAITARPDGSIDTHEVVGIDTDLIVKPWHQKGAVVSLREFTNNALNHHHGMQTVERFGPNTDHDNDGHRDELSVGDVTALTLFQALLAAPVEQPPEGTSAASVARGRETFTAIGCARCHVPELVLEDPVFTEPNPYNPPGNLGIDDVKAPIAIDLTVHGELPRLARERDGSVRVPAYTDLRRWDLGEDCDNEKLEQAGIATELFLTRRLWGMASEPPYLHHGRAYSLEEAIQMHGGDAADVREAYRALDDEQRRSVLDFLRSLTVAERSGVR